MSSTLNQAGSKIEAVDPFRVLFPIGATFAVGGAALWPLAAMHWIPYPGPTHASLMIQGFEQCFIMGFLLTAFPRFTRTPPCRFGELVAAVISVLGFGAAVLAGSNIVAQGFFLASMLVLLVVVGQRFLKRQNDPPEEAWFIGFGLIMGIVGSGIALASAAGVLIEPVPRIGLRMITLGMLLALVLGVGALLVPVFIGIRDPLVIPRIAKPHERPGRRALYLALIFLLLLSFGVEAFLDRGLAAWMRALVGVTMGLLVWKLYRLPRHRTVTGLTLWMSGWLVMLGLAGAATFPLYSIGALHLTFIGGFGLLTLGIGTRVLITHGGHSLEAEPRVLTRYVTAAIVMALLLRLLGEVDASSAPLLFALSGTAWILGWILWAVRALPRILHR